MNTQDPSLPDVVELGTDLFERLVERDHLLDQHRNAEGEHPRLMVCPAEPCRTWREYLALFTRWQAKRLPDGPTS